MKKKSKTQKGDLSGGGDLRQNIFGEVTIGATPTSAPEENAGKVTSRGRRIEVHRCKGGNGKWMVKVIGLVHAKEVEELAKTLKKSLAAGGTVRDREIEIQGDHRDKVLAFLKKKGYQAVPVGG